MAKVEVWHRCPVCQKTYDKQSGAIECRNVHPIKTESWAVGKGGKAVRIFDHCALDGRGGLKWALREADLSDDIQIRKSSLRRKQRE